MALTSGPPTRVSFARLIFLAVVIVAGLALFFVFSPRAQPVVVPEVEARP